VSFEWTRAQVDARTKAYLAGLPFRLDVRAGGGHAAGPRLILVHGTPTLNTVYWTEDRSDRFCLEMAEQAGARPGDVIAFGHTHLPWSRTIEGINFVNAGSVGRPRDGDWRACYAVIDLTADQCAVAFERVPYDVERAVAAIQQAGLPPEFGLFLRTGGLRAAAQAGDVHAERITP
jgi:diadenosine tetraphosphatase ApaH/serine/threonine PP2A family protein phosphatase